MKKSELKAKWGKYCNTDKLVDDMMAVLKANRHRCSEHGVCVVLDKYFQNKEPLIKMFITSNHYIGGMRIAVKKEFERDVDKNSIYNFCRDFPKNINAEKVLLNRKDEDGKTIEDYIKTGRKKVNLLSMGTIKSAEDMKKLDAFSLYYGATKKSVEKFENFMWYMDMFQRMYSSTMSRDVKDRDVELKHGTKTSRAFNKVCAHYGIDKASAYNKLFAQYADLVTTAARSLYFVISLNPLDYLTMSNGVNWTSCHRITSNNGSGGLAAGGCMSYMLDNCSIITYVVDSINEPIHNTGKIYRQMYYYGDDLFIQSRLYPQGNDGATNLYDKFRYFMQEEFAELLNVENTENWTHSRGVVNNFSENVGFHYPDAGYHSECGVFYPTEKESKMLRHKKITIGNVSYCCYCGKEQGTRSRLSHMDCDI